MSTQKLSGLKARIKDRNAEVYAWPVVMLGIDPATGEPEPMSAGGGLAPSQYDTVTLSPENDPTVISFALNGSPVGTIYVTRSGNDVTYSTIPPEE
jgi:hypothetical protein